jgi:hypothetical protein
MTRRIGNVVLLEKEPHVCCARCEQQRECRDIRGDGVQLCFDCATPQERKAYFRRIFGDQNSN